MLTLVKHTDKTQTLRLTNASFADQEPTTIPIDGHFQPLWRCVCTVERYGAFPRQGFGYSAGQEAPFFQSKKVLLTSQTPPRTKNQPRCLHFTERQTVCCQACPVLSHAQSDNCFGHKRSSHYPTIHLALAAAKAASPTSSSEETEEQPATQTTWPFLQRRFLSAQSPLVEQLFCVRADSHPCASHGFRQSNIQD
jgi:hypothetical protein